MRWAVAALRLEGPPCRRRGRPAPRPFRPLQLGRPSPRSPQEGGGASGVRPRPPAWDPLCVTCDPGAGPSPTPSPTSAAAAAPSRPRGPAPAPRARPVCKWEGPAANGRPGRARPAAPQPVSARRGADATPTAARPLAGAAGAFLSARRPRGGAATCRAGPGAPRCRSPAGPAGWYDPRSSPRPPRGGRRLSGSPRGSAHVAEAGAQEGLRPRDARTTRASRTHPGAIWLEGRGLWLGLVCPSTPVGQPRGPRSFLWDLSPRKARSPSPQARPCP